MGGAASLGWSLGPRPLHILTVIVLALCALTQASDDTETKSPKPTVTTAPIFLPHYSEESWSLVRGSIISSNATASETTYTIFCPPQTPPACDLSLDFPFIIVGGPRTVGFHGTVTSTYTANVECDLEGTTAATCSGYSSRRADYTDGFKTGPTEESWTSTFHSPGIGWGTLTMADRPSKTKDTPGITKTTGAATLESTAMYFVPSPTGAGASLRAHMPWALAVALGSAIFAGFIV